MKSNLTATIELITMALVGKTDASNAEEQLARDSQSKATNCRWDGGFLPSHFTNFADNSELCHALKKPDKTAPPKAVSLSAEGRKSLLTRKWICPIHAEPLQSQISQRNIFLKVKR